MERRARASRYPALIAAATAAVFSPVLAYPFLNWDDGHVFLRNAPLYAEGVLRWAFTTTYMEHYQPLAWLAWTGLARSAGLSPAYAHALNLVLHASCAVLVYLLALRFVPRRETAAAAALIFSLHPLRAEPVAWASAMPYPLALAFALGATIAWIDGRRRWALALYACSLLARPLALGLPAVFLVVELYPPTATRRHAKGAAAPALAAATALALLAAAAESSARLTATLEEVGVAARLEAAATAPFHYLRVTVAPVGLTPLDLAQPPDPNYLRLAAAALALVLVSWLAWRARVRTPAILQAWSAYLALLLPAAGLVPSGLQATADRYTYVPSVPLAIAAAAALWIPAANRVVFARTAAAIIIATLAMVAWLQLRWWSDSITLWTRAVNLHPGNEVALYNLGTALADAGRADQALVRYEQVLRVAPDHADARANRDLLRAVALEEQGNRLAAGGRLKEAASAYADAIALDPKRTHAHAARGMALVHAGQAEEALAPLEAAVRLGSTDPAVAGALAIVLAETGKQREARDVLRAALERHPADLNLAHNLARLLATSGDPAVRDPVTALVLATRVNDAVGGRDPRVLDTMAAAYAASGRLAEALRTSQRAAVIARERDPRLAAEILANARRYERR